MGNEWSTMTPQGLGGWRSDDLATVPGEIAAWSADVNARQPGVNCRGRSTPLAGALKSVYVGITL